MTLRAAGELPQLNWLMRHTCATQAQRDQRARAAPPPPNYPSVTQQILETTTAGNQSQPSTRFIYLT